LTELVPEFPIPTTFILAKASISGVILSSFCGDSTPDFIIEECDDGNANDKRWLDGGGDAGDCIIDPDANGLLCKNNGVCGDGYLNSTEECDDGNTGAGDGCSSACIPDAGSVTGDFCADFTPNDPLAPFIYGSGSNEVEKCGDYSSLTSVNYALDDKTTVNSQYQWWTADGTDAISKDISLGLARTLPKDLVLKVGYAYNTYDEGENAGINDYKANIIYTTLTGNF